MIHGDMHVSDAGMIHHTVSRTDSLRSIAEQYYNDGSKWPVIYRFNKHYIQNPNQLQPGQVIVIPHMAGK